MPCHSAIPDTLPIIETSYIGVLTIAELAAKADEISALVALHGRHLLLGDCTALLGTPNALMDLHGLAEELSHNPVAGHVKEALILPTAPDAAEMIRFWEMICRNRGIMVRTFPDRAGALAWLLSGNGA